MTLSVGVPPAADLAALLLGGLLIGFIAGAIPFGYLAGRLRGLDIRRHGSGNVGFTNVARTMGWPYAVPVLALDVAKGFLPVLFGGSLLRIVGGPAPGVELGPAGAVPELFSVLLGAGAIAGHLFSPFLHFRGGKGVATAAGVFMALSPLAVAVCLGVFVVMLLLFRYVSLASIVTALILPIPAALLPPRSSPILALALTAAIVIVLRHVSNIRRLVGGTETRFRFGHRPSRTVP
jgi:glycerol-3-phosphate acyltransferase PlsY